MVVADQLHLSLVVCLAGLAEPRRAMYAPAAAAAADPAAQTALVASNPWMLHHLDMGKAMIKKNSPYDDILADTSNAQAHDDDQVVKMAADIMRDLAEVRAIARVGVDIEHCRIGALGDAWSLREQGVLFDAFKSWDSGAEVCDWCDRYML